MSIDKTMQSPGIQSEKIKVSSIYVIVSEHCNKPYYEILYKEVGNNFCNIGYSSFSLEQVLYWKHHCFEMVPVDENERKDNKYRWHDLRKNPNDLPEVEHEVEVAYITKCTNGKAITARAVYEDGSITQLESAFDWEEYVGNDGECNYNKEKDEYMIPVGWFESHWYGEDCHEMYDAEIIAWREIEPFKEK